MNIAEILELDEVRLLEPLFSDLIYQEMDDLIQGLKADSGRILVDEDENPQLFAAKDERGTWNGCCTLFRRPSLQLIDYFEQMDWEMYQENRETILDAVREYYSVQLCNTVTPGADDLNPDRARSIADLIRQTIGRGGGITCLDCACGTGVGSAVMEQNNMHPVAYDNDESLLVRGMNEGRLRPERTMWIDGRLIDQYLYHPVELACGFMVGEIHSFNAGIWQEIITAACRVAERILITTGTEPEILQVQEWISSTGKKVEMFESDSDPIYDRWVCYSE